MNSLNEIHIDINKTFISIDETHHIYKGLPLYKTRFKSVMNFHNLGVAAVMDYSGCYHINLNGEPIYNERFLKSFGYYDNKAAVMDDSGWYHINIRGEPIYKERYDWVGNFQEDRCVVRNKHGYYSHINPDGDLVYSQLYKYAGDFKYGIAVVYNNDGYARHIDKQGNFIHSKEFLELGVYHKGYATAKDNYGAFHINKNGEQVYSGRFKWVEPFYNGFAFVCKYNGEKLIINERGKIIHKIYDQTSSNIQNSLKNHLKGMLVSYWKTQIIKSIVDLEILELIKNGKKTLRELQEISQIPISSLDIILKVLKIWDFIKEVNDTYELKYLGSLLTEDNPMSLKYAALMWGGEHYEAMSKLTEALKDYKPKFKKTFGKSIFEYFNTNKERGAIFNKAMKTYAIDYEKIINLYNFLNTHVLLDIGGGTGDLLEKILSTNRHIEKAVLFELPSVIEDAKKSISNESVKVKIEFIEGNFFEQINLKADTIMMSRVLHDWNDEDSIIILKNVYNALEDNGNLLIFEMIIPEDPEYDFGVTLNFNLLVNVGGKERTYKEFRNILQRAGFSIKSIITGENIISLIIVKKIRS